MSGHHTYEESIKKVYKGLILLGAVTLMEVLISLFGKGYLGFDPDKDFLNIHIGFLGLNFNWLLALVALGLVAFSLYKAYFIIYEFMHMRYETKSLSFTVLLPMLLLVWGIIAFFQDGNSWGSARQEYKEHTSQEIDEGIRPINPDEELIIKTLPKGE